MNRIIGYIILASLVALSGVVSYGAWYFFLRQHSSWYRIQVESKKRVRKGDVFLARFDTSLNAKSIIPCGYVRRINKKYILHVYPEYSHMVTQDTQIYYFNNDILNYRHIFPMEALVPHIKTIIALMFSDAKNLLGSDYFRKTYQPRIIALAKRNLQKTMKDPQVNRRLNKLFSRIKKRAGEELSKGPLGKELKKLAVKGASKHLVKSKCIILKKPYIKPKCLNKFMTWYAQKVSTSKVVGQETKDFLTEEGLGPKAQATYAMLINRFLNNLAKDKGINILLNDMGNDKNIQKAFTPTLNLAKNILKKEAPALLFANNEPNPIIVLYIRETFINRKKRFWLLFSETVPRHFTDRGYALERVE